MKKALLGLFLVLCLAAPRLLGADAAPVAPPAAAAVTPASTVAAAPVIEPAKPADDPAPAVDETKPSPNPPDISKIEKEDPTTFTEKIKTAYAAKEWGILIGFVLMLIVFLVVKYLWTAFPAKWLPYMSVAFGVLGDVGWQLAIGGQVWWRAILAGLTSGATAVGMWELIGKKIFGSMGNAQAAAPKK